MIEVKFSPCLSQVEKRYAELTAMGVDVSLVCVGIKGKVYFKRRPQYKIASMSRCHSLSPDSLQSSSCDIHLILC